MSGFIGTKLTMNLGERSYDIILKNGALENLYQFARLDRRVAVVTDAGETITGVVTSSGSLTSKVSSLSSTV